MTVNFEMVQGDTRYMRFTCYNSDGTILNLATANAATFGVIEYGKTNGNTIISKTFSSGIVIEDTNVAVVKLDPSDTSSINGKFEYTFTLDDFTNDTFSSTGLFIINISAN